MKLKLTLILALCAINQTFGMGEAARLAMVKKYQDANRTPTTKTITVHASFEPQADALADAGLIDDLSNLVREYLFDAYAFLPAHSSITNENSKQLLENYNPAERQEYAIIDLNPNSRLHRPLFFNKDLRDQLNIKVSGSGLHHYAYLTDNHILLFKNDGTIELWNMHTKAFVHSINCLTWNHHDARRLSFNSTEYPGIKPCLAGYILKTNRKAQALWPRLPLQTLYTLQYFIHTMDNLTDLSLGLAHFIELVHNHKLPLIMQQHLANHYRLKMQPAVLAELQTMTDKDFVRLKKVITSINTAHLQQNIGSSRPAPSFKEITSAFKKLSPTMQEYLQNYYVVTLKPQSACVIQ